MTGLKGSFRDIQKNIQALKQSNLTVNQMPNMMKEIGVWWKITRNLRELEGSWVKTVKTYIHLFKGVPRKDIHKPFDTKGA
jgi:sulfatase maturation enzyme AslB (radical SAM superfamily)